VLRYVAQARARGLGVIFISHNPHHAYAVGDRFTILKRGHNMGTFRKDEIERDEIVRMMSGAEELDALRHELEEFSRRDADARGEMSAAEPQVAEAPEEPR